jgi:CheY-like chemotaxis protein
MAYGTMRSHGGAIRVTSRVGEGAAFELLFPSVEAEAPTTAAAPRRESVSARALRVLFVDDEPQLVRLAHRTLEPLGHSVVSYSCPLEALDAFRVAPSAFDVVVTDLSMPGMSGIDLTRALRASRTDIPVVMVTGYADEADAVEAQAAGVTRLATKASDAQQLPRLLAEVVRTT